MNNKKKVTIYDLAEALGISVGTVYRALHNTGRIKADTRQQVLDMSDKMGYKANHVAQGLRRNPIYIGVILCCPVIQYLNEIERGIKSAFDSLAEYKVVSDIHILCGINSKDDTQAIQSILEEFSSKKYQGVVLFLSGDNSIFSDQIMKMAQSGIAVANVVNDIPESGSVVSVSVDGQCAGRLAAELLYLCCPNRNIAILTGSNSTTIHKENLAGFLQYAKNHPFNSIDIFEHEDRPDEVIRKISIIIQSKDKYQGMYITSASSMLACQYLEKSDISGHIKIVTTDLFEENKILLKNEVVCATIFQNPYKLGNQAVKQLYQYICNKSEQKTILLMPQLIFQSNMDFALSDTN